MAEVIQLKLSEAHLSLARRLRIVWSGDKPGGPGIDSKSPYGNADIAADVIKIAGIPVARGQDDAARELALTLHQDMLYVTQIVMQFAGLQIVPGVYRRSRPADPRSWEWMGNG